MKNLETVVLVVLMVFFAAGSASAVMLPLVNGDFETAQPAWGRNPAGWVDWGGTGGAQIPLDAVCPDGGAKAIIYSGATNVNSGLVFAQLTENVIQSGQTYTLAMDVGTEAYYTYQPQYPQATVLAVLCASDALGNLTQLGVITSVDADFTGNYQWKTYSASYVADGTYAGQKLLVYVQFIGKDYGPWVDSVRLSAVPEPATMAILLTGMVGMLLKKRRNA